MGRSTLEVADIVREHRDAYEALRGGSLSATESRVLDDIVHCRTAFFGGHLLRCNECGHEDISYNSCRNRHCPKCQAAARVEWLTQREKELLPVQYFHVVFTVPKQIASVAFQNKKVVYDILLQTSAETLRQVAATPKYLGAEIAVLSVLHTWGQNLQHHPHVHCVIPGGGIAADGSHWKRCRDGFFLPVHVLGSLFRGKFLARLRTAYDKGLLEFHRGTAELTERSRFKEWLSALYEKDWVVYAQRPFGGPEHVLRHLAHYTHRTATSHP
ncbi:MAG: transposase, partial [bacterium]|nr:transposase [bacterium]